MAVTHKLFGPALQSIANGSIAGMVSTAVIKVALVAVGGEGYTFSQAHDEWEDVSAYEIADADYTPGGEIIANKQLNYADRVTTFKTTDAKTVFTADGSITAGGAVIYSFVDDGEGDPHGTNSKLIGFIDFDGDETSSDGEFAITWHENGIFTMTVAA